MNHFILSHSNKTYVVIRCSHEIHKGWRYNYGKEGIRVNKVRNKLDKLRTDIQELIYREEELKDVIRALGEHLRQTEDDGETDYEKNKEMQRYIEAELQYHSSPIGYNIRP